MTQYDLTPPPPSWTPVIIVGAFAAFLSQFVSLTVVSMMPLALPCCCAMEALPVGVGLGLWALRRDVYTTPGQGFAVSFIAAGLGSAVIVILAIMVTNPQNLDLIANESQRVLEQANAELPAGERLSEEDIDAAVQMMVDIQPYIPIVRALVFSTISGVCGLFAVGLLRRRASRQVMPPPPPA